MTIDNSMNSMMMSPEVQNNQLMAQKQTEQTQEIQQTQIVQQTQIQQQDQVQLQQQIAETTGIGSILNLMV